MRWIICQLLIVISVSSFAAQALDIAVETGGIRVEYIASSDRGIIRVRDCKQCSQSYYKFPSPPIIQKQGREILFSEFLTDYWQAKFPTLILDKQSLNVSKVVY